MPDPETTVHVFDPPRPVVITAYGGRPPGLLLRWRWAWYGWCEEWRGVVRLVRDGKEVVHSLPPYYLDVDPADYPFKVEPVESAPPPSHDRVTCPYCRGS